MNDSAQCAGTALVAKVDPAVGHHDFAEAGYLCVPEGAPAALCAAFGAAILAEYRALIDGGWRFAGGGKFARHFNCAPGQSVRPLLDAVEAAGLTAFVSDVFGTPLRLSSVNCNLNLPGSAYQDFHTDSPFGEAYLVVNLCLVETTIENGATEIVAGSHRTELNAWTFMRGGFARRSQRPTARPGDILMRTSTLWHRGTPNRSTAPRPMLALIYERAEKVPADRVPVGLTGNIRIFGNRFQATAKGRLLELVSVYLPWLDRSLRIGRGILQR